MLMPLSKRFWLKFTTSWENCPQIPITPSLMSLVKILWRLTPLRNLKVERRRRTANVKIKATVPPFSAPCQGRRRKRGWSYFWSQISVSSFVFVYEGKEVFSVRTLEVGNEGWEPWENNQFVTVQWLHSLCSSDVWFFLFFNIWYFFLLLRHSLHSNHPHFCSLTIYRLSAQSSFSLFLSLTLFPEILFSRCFPFWFSRYHCRCASKSPETQIQ